MTAKLVEQFPKRKSGGEESKKEKTTENWRDFSLMSFSFSSLSSSTASAAVVIAKQFDATTDLATSGTGGTIALHF